MSENVERKFRLLAVSTEHGRVHTEADAVLFLAKDRAFLPTLRFYFSECEKIGAGAKQLTAVNLLIERVMRWQLDHPEAMKVPDVDDSPAGQSIVAPNRKDGT
jgi:hypothetical protein